MHAYIVSLQQFVCVCILILKVLWQGCIIINNKHNIPSATCNAILKCLMRLTASIENTEQILMRVFIGRSVNYRLCVVFFQKLFYSGEPTNYLSMQRRGRPEFQNTYGQSQKDYLEVPKNHGSQTFWDFQRPTTNTTI